jgi:hypothetical protein
MRTRSFICILLVVTAAAFGGQRIKPTIPHDLITRTDPFASPRATPVRNPQLKSWFERHQFPTKIAADHFRVSSEFTPVAPTFDPNVLHRVAGRTSDEKSQSTRLAPFDTVYEQGFYGPRRHIYTYNGQGNTLQRSTQIKSTSGWDETDRVVCTYTPAGLLATRTENAPPYREGFSERDRYTYNSEGLMTSYTRECFDPVTGKVQSAEIDSIVYDQQGNRISEEWENWYEGEGTFGSRIENWRSDSLHVYIAYGRIPGGWIPVERQSSHYGQQNGEEEVINEVWNGSRWTNTSRTLYGGQRNGEEEIINEVWNGSRWTNMSRTLYTQRNMGNGVYSITWIWEDKDWTLASRWIFVGEQGMLEYRNENRKGENWVPAARHRYRIDEQGRTVSHLEEIWDNGWHIDHSLVYVYGADGSYRQIDSSWADGALSRVGESACDAAGHSLGFRSEYWQNGAVIDGWAITYSYTAAGRNAEVISSAWIGGKWELFYRYAFVYDENDHIRSLKHYIFNSGEWEQSYRYSAFETTNYSGSDWDLDNYSDNRRDRNFIGFSELTFAYRTEVSAIAQECGTVPERSTLRQNHPNPFNPTTTIPFAVSTGAQTTLVIYDILGREVNRPVDEWKDPGEYKVQFDAAALASGMYICRFTSGAVSQTSKLMLVR